MKKIDYKKYEARCQCCGKNTVPLKGIQKVLIRLLLWMGLSEAEVMMRIREKRIKHGYD